MVETLQQNYCYPQSEPPAKAEIKAKQGSGGEFLSNEIYYRVSRLRDKHNKNLPTGHFHIPLIQASKYFIETYVEPFNKEVELSKKVQVETNFNSQRTKSIISKITDLIKQTLSIFIFLFFFTNNSYSQPLYQFRTFDIFDGNKLISPSDTNYLICPTNFGEEGHIVYISKGDSRISSTFTITKLATYETMIIKTADISRNYKDTFRKGEVFLGPSIENEYVSPDYALTRIEIFDGDKLITPSDTNYYICPKPYVVNDIAYYSLHNSGDFDKLITITITITKLTTYESMIIKVAYGSINNRAIFKSGIVDLSNE